MSFLEPVMVVGGYGSLGHHIVKKLLQAGAVNITVFDVNISKNVLLGVIYV